MIRTHQEIFFAELASKISDDPAVLERARILVTSYEISERMGFAIMDSLRANGLNKVVLTT